MISILSSHEFHTRSHVNLEHVMHVEISKGRRNELTANKLGCNCENPSVITPLSTWKILSGYY